MNDFSSDDNNLDLAAEQISTSLKAFQILEKARNEGIPMNELVFMNQAGRSKVVTAKEKERSSQLRRKELVDLMRKRTLRGDHSLVQDVTERITSCQTLVELILKQTQASPQELVSVRRDLEASQNRATSLAKDVQVLEQAIERKKQEDPAIRNFENASSELLKAMQEKDVERVKELREFCEDNMDTYNLRKRRLKPYISKAREARLKFIIEKRRIMKVQFQTYVNITELFASGMNAGTFQSYDNESVQKATELIHRLREQRTDSLPRVEKLNQNLVNVPLSFLPDIESELDAIDSVDLNPMKENVNELIGIVRDAEKAAKAKELETEIKQSDGKRMAYQQKQKD